MRRKVYDSLSERYADRRRAIPVFIVVNLAVLVAYLYLREQFKQATPGDRLFYQRTIEIIPWLANILPLLGGFLWRPEVAVGYLACFGIILIGIIGATVLFFASCVLGGGIGALFGPPGVVIGIALFIGLFLGGLGWGLVQLVQLASEWWGVR